MTKKFSKHIEDFVCEKCGKKVKGTGYTNHCPDCLWSKHVDVNPGDRQCMCGGMMKPIRTEYVQGEFVIVHHCIKCGIEKRNGAAENDNKELLFNLLSVSR